MITPSPLLNAILAATKKPASKKATKKEGKK